MAVPPIRFEVPAARLAGAVALGVAVAIVYTLSPLTVIAAVALPLLLRRGARGLTEAEQWWLRAIVVAAVAVRVLAVIAMALAADHDSQGAAILTGDEAYALARTLRIRNIVLGLPAAKYDYEIAFEDYGQSSYLGLLTIAQLLFGPSPYGLRLINILLFVSAALLLFRWARAAFGTVPAFLSIAALVCLPTLFFWSISLLKESLYLLLGSIVLTATYAVFTHRAWPGLSERSDRRLAIRLGSIAAVAFALWSLRDLRPGAVALVGGGAALGAAMFWITGSVRRIVTAAPVVVITIVVALLQPAVRTRLTTALDEAARIQIGHVFTVGHAYKTLDENLYVIKNPYINLTPQEAARYVIRSLASFVAAPWPWRIATRSELVFLPELMLWYVTMGLAVVGIAAGLRRDRLATCLLVGMCIPTTIVVALTNGNVGTLIRFRGLVWPYVLVLGAVGACAAAERSLAGRRSVQEALSDSLAGRTLSDAADRVGAAVAASRLLGIFRASGAAFAALPPAQRVRLAGAALIAFVVTHVLLLQTIPLSVAPLMPLFGWAEAAIVAVVLLVGADAFARAWTAKQRSISAGSTPQS